jgi:murein DD-endopeptidase MepM/ murein hydrolase activator NlpD
VPPFVDEVLAALQAGPVDAIPAPAGAEAEGTGRHRAAAGTGSRRRPALVLAAALVAAIGLGALADRDPAASADTIPGAEAVSVAEQLGIEAEPPAALADAEATRLLQGMVASRNARDAAQTAAAQAQAAADVSAVLAAAQAFEAAAEAARPKVVAPIHGARLTSGFGARWGTSHAGIDLAAPMRTPEYAVMDGVVLEAGAASGYGLVVYIQHHNGFVTAYGHMDEILVEPGQSVRAGDTIALLGNRGQSTGPHLHFEVIVGGKDGTRINPIPWLRERGVTL